jgi:UDP-sulfoquinovose synthase
MQSKQTIFILGGDGYLGWSLGLAFANRTNYKVVLLDNFIKREWEKAVHAKLLVPLKQPAERIAEFKKIFGKNNLSFETLSLLDDRAIVRMIKKHRPFAIINAAQQPSAPFAMMNPKNSADTFSNNIIGHLNVLWAIAEADKSIKYIKLGSAGCYMGTDTEFVPLGKKDFQFKHKGKSQRISKSWIPMYATDFYHQSKITDFYISELCADIWGLRLATIQQSTIFGATIEENYPLENHGLSTRFNYDAVFSTVLNRFVCQLAIGHPLTVYGKGDQRTGIISLSDTVDNFIKFTEMDIKPGQHVVAHNYTHRLSIKEIAEAITNIAGVAKVNHIKNPRKEPDGKFSKKVEMHPLIKEPTSKKQRKLQQELTNLLEFTKQYKKNIDRSIIMPKVQWQK